MDALKGFFADNLPQFEYLLRILLAGLCGGLVGFERSRRQKEAGIRTHIIVALASALAGIVSKYAFTDMLNMAGIGLEPSRIASNVLTGIGFLGAGIIFVRGGSVKGLTTAAGVWATSIVGLAIGTGMYIVGVGSALLIIVIQIVIHTHIPGDMATPGRIVLKVKSATVPVVSEIKTVLGDMRIIVTKVEMTRLDEGGVQLDLVLRLPKEEFYEELLSLSEKYPEIVGISV